MKEFFAEIAAKPLNSYKTDISIIFYNTVKYGPVGRLLGETLLKAKIASSLAAINEHIETGEPVQKKGRLLKQ
jgi:hypothetical protein